MTVHTTNTPTTQHFLDAAGRRLKRLFWTLAWHSRGARAARRAERLMALSDAELAKRGLRRDEILHRAFGPYLGL